MEYSEDQSAGHLTGCSDRQRHTRVYVCVSVCVSVCGLNSVTECLYGKSLDDSQRV